MYWSLQKLYDDANRHYQKWKKTQRRGRNAPKSYAEYNRIMSEISAIRMANAV